MLEFINQIKEGEKIIVSKNTKYGLDLNNDLKKKSQINSYFELKNK